MRGKNEETMRQKKREERYKGERKEMKDLREWCFKGWVTAMLVSMGGIWELLLWLIWEW